METTGVVYEPPPLRSQVEHDEQRRLFRITGEDGKAPEFHYRPVRFLVVEPDPRTGKLEPAFSGGQPRVIYLCREAGL